MKTEKIEQLILLEQSGELGFFGRWQLRRALAAQPDAAKFRNDLIMISEASRSATPPGSDLPSGILGEIRKAAAEQSQHSVPIDAVFGSWLRPAIALAAIVVVVLGIGVVNQISHNESKNIATSTSPRKAHVKWDDELDADISQLGTMLAVNVEAASDAGSLDANMLARELLAMEGTQQ